MTGNHIKNKSRDYFMRRFLTIFAVLALCISFSSQALAQEKPNRINVDLLKTFIKESGGVLMMRVEKGQLVVLNKDRDVIFPKGHAKPDDSEPFYVFRVGILAKLITLHEKFWKNRNNGGWRGERAYDDEEFRTNTLQPSTMGAWDDGLTIPLAYMMTVKCPPACYR